MGSARFGTVGYSYRDWAGIFFPPGSPPRRQFNIYAGQFDVCELTQFMHQMPDPERMVGLAAQIRTDLKFFVRLHNTFTHCSDAGLASALAKHFRSAMEPLHADGRLAGLVAAFPYAFKNTPDNREYILQVARMLAFGADCPLQVDFRHASWYSAEAIRWMTDHGLALVCVDEPDLPGLLPRLAVATANRVLVRMHGRNGAGWWSGNMATRFDYSYGAGELAELKTRFQPLLERELDVCFLFNNNWQAQSVTNALQLRELLACKQPAAAAAKPGSDETANFLDDESQRPRSSLPMADVKSRVRGALAGLQGALDLPPREER